MAKFKQKYEQTESNQSRTPEQQLWISVLTKAADDAIYTSDWLEARKAIAWFRSNNKEFKEVCQYAGFNPDYVAGKMERPLNEREQHMECVRSGVRLYVKGKRPTIYHSHYRLGKKRGKYKKKHLTGNAYYKAKREKDPHYVKIGKLGGRPRMYNGI